MNSRNADYVSRINKVLDYIDQHLAESMTLDDLASVANFSKFHFHRIFFAFIGETIYDYIQRLRIETSAARLLSNANSSITEIAYDAGFSSASVYSRSFKKIMNCTPTEFRENNTLSNSKIYQSKSNNCTTHSNISTQPPEQFPYFRSTISCSIKRRAEMFENQDVKMEVKQLPATTVAYVRYIGPYAGDSQLFEGLYQKLFAWAGPRQLLNFPETKCLCIYHDDPSVTEPAKLRTSVCISVPESTKVDGEIGLMTLQACSYAVCKFEIDSTQFGEAWSSTCGAIAAAGLEFADGLSFELYLNDHNTHPEKKFIVEICVPVRKV